MKKSPASDVLFLAAAVSIVAGAFWIYPPAGLLVLGAFCLLASIATR